MTPFFQAGRSDPSYIILAITRHVSVLTISTKSTPLFPTTSHALLHYCTLVPLQVFSTTWRTLASFSFSYITKFACAEWSSKCHITRLFITEQKTQNQMHQTDRTTYKSTPKFHVLTFVLLYQQNYMVFGFWFYLSIFHTNLAFRFCTFYIFGKSSVVCPLFVVGMKEKKKKSILDIGRQYSYGNDEYPPWQTLQARYYSTFIIFGKIRQFMWGEGGPFVFHLACQFLILHKTKCTFLKEIRSPVTTVMNTL